MIALCTALGTAGLDPKTDALLECAIEVLEFLPGKPVHTIYSFDVLNPCGYTPDRLAEIMVDTVPKVAEMHEASGLWSDLITKDPLMTDPDVAAMLDALCGEQKPILVAFNIDWTSRYLAAHMPFSNQRMRSDALDMGTVLALLGASRKAKSGDRAHYKAVEIAALLCQLVRGGMFSEGVRP